MVIQSTQFVKELLTECFITDQPLISKWHIKAGSGLEACVEKTLQDLIESNVEVFKVTDGLDTVGYFGRESFGDELYLTGFFIKPSFRSNQKRSEFWSLVSTQFQKPFYCGLYKKNQPAINFIERNNGQIVREVSCPDGQVLLFKVGA